MGFLRERYSGAYVLYEAHRKQKSEKTCGFFTKHISSLLDHVLASFVWDLPSSIKDTKHAFQV